MRPVESNVTLASNSKTEMPWECVKWMEAGPVINQGKKLTSRIYNHKITFPKWQYTEALGIINQNVFNQQNISNSKCHTKQSARGHFYCSFFIPCHRCELRQCKPLPSPENGSVKCNVGKYAGEFCVVVVHFQKSLTFDSMCWKQQRLCHIISSWSRENWRQHLVTLSLYWQKAPSTWTLLWDECTL